MEIISTLLVQLGILWRNPQGNLDALECALDELTISGGGLLVVPEMFLTGFTEEIAELAEPIGGPWERSFRALMDRHGLAAILGIVRKHPDQRLHNEALFLEPAQDEATCAYQKRRLFLGEQQAVHAGATVRTFTFQGVSFCPLICYDLRFPELFREGLQQGAEVFIVIASWPMKRHAHWELLLQARAIENQAYVIGVNRCGSDPHHDYGGGTMVVTPHGTICHHSGNEASIEAVELNIGEVREWRAKFPAVSDFLS
jgi:predicted amidohydrolase